MVLVGREDVASDGADVNNKDGDFDDVGAFKLSTYTRIVAAHTPACQST